MYDGLSKTRELMSPSDRNLLYKVSHFLQIDANFDFIVSNEAGRRIRERLKIPSDREIVCDIVAHNVHCVWVLIERGRKRLEEAVAQLENTLRWLSVFVRKEGWKYKEGFCVVVLESLSRIDKKRYGIVEGKLYTKGIGKRNKKKEFRDTICVRDIYGECTARLFVLRENIELKKFYRRKRK